jgi:LytTR family transcriptional regulator, CO-responsive transcriptional regulator RcoM
VDHDLQSFSYRLKKLDMGLVLLDKSWRITACDPIARGLLGRLSETLQGRSILDLHPPSSRQKVEWLLESAAHGPASLIVALPDRTLMVRVVTLDADERRDGEGGSALAMVLFEMDGGAEDRSRRAAAVEAGDGAAAPVTPAVPAALAKLPISRHDGVFLLDPEKAIYLKANGHDTSVMTSAGPLFCAMSLLKLEQGLEGGEFVRVHRSYIVSLSHATGLLREDGRMVIVMDAPGNPRIPVGRNHMEQVRRRLGI